MSYTELRSDSRFRALSSKYTRLIVGLPILLVSSYYLYQRVGLGRDAREDARAYLERREKEKETQRGTEEQNVPRELQTQAGNGMDRSELERLFDGKMLGNATAIAGATEKDSSETTNVSINIKSRLKDKLWSETAARGGDSEQAITKGWQEARWGGEAAGEGTTSSSGPVGVSGMHNVGSSMGKGPGRVKRLLEE